MRLGRHRFRTGSVGWPRAPVPRSHRPHRQHAHRAAAEPPAGRRCAAPGQARVPESGRLDQGPDRAADDRGRGARGQARARRHHRRAHRGNTGVGLAMAAARKGYRCVFVMPDKMRGRRSRPARATAPRSSSCPTDVEPDDPRSLLLRRRERLAEETPNAWKPDQYSNPDNPAAHVRDDRAGDLGAARRGARRAGRRRRHGRHRQRHHAVPAARSCRTCRSSAPTRRARSTTRRARAAVPGRGRRRGLLARHVRALVGRPLGHGVRPRRLPHHAAGGARGGPAHRRLLRPRDARRASRWRASCRPTRRCS